MKKIALSMMVAAMLMPLGATAEQPHIVPQPAHYEQAEGTFAIPSEWTVAGNGSTDAQRFLKMHGIDANAEQIGLITTNIDSTLAPESYVLTVTPTGISINAADLSGLMYGVETLTQMLDQAADGLLDACVITDQPRMAYRGLMLDVVRCYLPVDELKKYVDVAAQLKLNKLHLHLTDDNGWRMEIKQYPKLTEVGAWRVDRPEIFPARANAKEGEPTTYGGYYTQDELRDLVKYAAERQIDIIPEIEMPAHSIAAIASYPELCCPVYDDFIGVLPGIGGKAASIIMCAGEDNTLTFVKNVLDEVMDVFPYEYIHLGGDEAEKSHWKKCPKCNKRIADEGLGDYEELQGWFMDRINSYVREHGRTAIGWDEVTYGKPKEDMVIMGWQGDGHVAVKYARETGRRFIMTPAKKAYLIRYQGPQWFEPFTYFGNITLKDAYEFEPTQADWTDAMRDQLWGVQGSMWTEFCRTPSDVQHQIFPRLIAIADVAWRQEGERDWQGFVKATDNFVQRLDDADVTWAKSMYNIQHTAVPSGDGSVTVTAECIRPDANITVSRTPDRDFPTLYTEPIEADGTTTLYLRADCDNGHHGETLVLPLNFNAATGRSVKADGCTNGLERVITNGLRASLRNSDFEWAGWYGKDAAFTVDLGSVMPIERISVGMLGNANLNVALPPQLRMLVAGEDENFSEVATFSLSQDEMFPLTALVHEFDASGLKTQGRYVRIEADGAGRIPLGMPREDNTTWIYFDELTVE